MKNQTILFLSMAILSFFAISCGTVPQPGPGMQISYQHDTIVSHYGYITTPINLCAGGQSKFKKIVDSIMVYDSIRLGGIVNISDQQLQDAGYHYDGKKYVSAGNNGSFHFGNFPWNWLLGLLGLAFLIWIISLIIRNWPDRHVNHTHNHHHTYEQPEAKAKPEEEKSNLSAIDYLKFSSEKNADGKEITKLKYESGIPIDVLLSGMKQSGSGDNHTIINVFGDGDNHITVTNNGKKPVPPVPPAQP